jgi:hypothetical protein
MAKKIKEEVIDLGNGVELTMVLIPKGKFLMGSPQVKNIVMMMKFEATQNLG